MALQLPKTLQYAFVALTVFSCRDLMASEHVWARTNYGASNINRPYSSMSNGYGGYYVPRNGYGNNYEGQRFTNPDGFVIPGQSQYSYSPRTIHYRRW